VPPSGRTLALKLCRLATSGRERIRRLGEECKISTQRASGSSFPAPFHRILFGLLTRISVHAVPLDRLPLDLRRAASEARLKELRASGESSEELLELFASENENLNELLATAGAENDELHSQLVTHEQNYAAIAATVDGGSVVGTEEAADLETDAVLTPESWLEFVENLAALESRAFVVTPAAREMCSPSPYPDPARMWWHLERLAEAAEAWASQSCSVGQDLSTWIRENYGIEVALHDADLGGAPFHYDGKVYSREPHVKVDDHKSPDECGRIYFAYVTDERRFIVDHIGLHL
jgi:hypothetical protein